MTSDITWRDTWAGGRGSLDMTTNKRRRIRMTAMRLWDDADVSTPELSSHRRRLHPPLHLHVAAADRDSKAIHGKNAVTEFCPWVIDSIRYLDNEIINCERMFSFVITEIASMICFTYVRVFFITQSTAVCRIFTIYFLIAHDHNSNWPWYNTTSLITVAYTVVYDGWLKDVC